MTDRGPSASSRRQRAALGIALREFRVTFLVLALLVAPVVYVFHVGGLAALAVAVVLQYLHEFVKSYRKAYDELTLIDEEVVVLQEARSPSVREHRAAPDEPRRAEPRRAEPRGAEPRGAEPTRVEATSAEPRRWRVLDLTLAVLKWAAAAVFVSWVLLSLLIYIYR